MKLLLITAVEEFEKDVIEILRRSGAKSFSYQSVSGYIDTTDTDVENWFGSGHEEVESLLFTVFAQGEVVEKVYKKIEDFNAKQERLSNIHIAIIPTEKFI